MKPAIDIFALFQPSFAQTHPVTLIMSWSITEPFLHWDKLFCRNVLSYITESTQSILSRFNFNLYFFEKPLPNDHV